MDLSKTIANVEESLYFKSEPTPVSKNATVPPNAVLCTDDETFEVQQVQSSDSLYILQPVQNTTSTHGEYSDTGGVSVMAECNMILEVVARPTSAVPYLKRRIPVYDMSQLEARMLGKGNEFSDTGQIIDKQELLDNSSSCLKELDKGLVELCVYYTEKYAWRPSEAVLIAAWRSFMSAVTVKGLRINQSLQMSEVADLMMEDGFTLSLIQAFFQRLAPKIDDAEDGKFTPPFPLFIINENSDREATSAYRDNCVPWVGSLLLRTLPLTGDTVQGFMSRWRDTLPEVWQEHAILELLQVIDTSLQNVT